MADNLSEIGSANHWCGDSRLNCGTTTSFSTFVGHIYRSRGDGCCIEEAYAGTVEEAVSAYKTAVASHNAQKPEGIVKGSKTGFVWVDLHGVPPLPDSTEYAAKGGAMDCLWETLELNEKHRKMLQEQVAEECQRRASLLGSNGLNTGNIFSSALPTTKTNVVRALVTDVVHERQVTQASDLECFCAGQISEAGLENLIDPDSLHLYKKAAFTNAGKGAGEKFYTALCVATLLEHTIQYSPPSEERAYAINLAAQRKKQDMFSEISQISHDVHVNPFLRSANLASDTPHISFAENLHNRQKSDSTTNDSIDHLLLEKDDYSGVMRLRESEQTSSNQFGIIHVFCWRGLCVTWCPRSTSILSNGHRCLWQAKNWTQFRETVLSQFVYSPPCSPRSEVGENSAFPIQQESTNESITTASFVTLFMSTVCYNYLPNINALLSEVEAIDFMMPLIQPKLESDQSDVYRRILMLRHRLSKHRRELNFKKALLNSLRGPSVNTLAAFMTQSCCAHSQQQAAFGVCTNCFPSSAPAATTALNAIEGVIDEMLRKMDTSRMLLGNSTMLYNSNVISSNYEISNNADYFMVLVHYVFITIMPAHIVSGQFGVNFTVPFKDLDSLTPFYTILGVLVGICVLALIFPFWAYSTGRMHLIM